MTDQEYITFSYIFNTLTKDEKFKAIENNKYSYALIATDKRYIFIQNGISYYNSIQLKKNNSTVIGIVEVAKYVYCVLKENGDVEILCISRMGINKRSILYIGDIKNMNIIKIVPSYRVLSKSHTFYMLSSYKKVYLCTVNYSTLIRNTKSLINFCRNPLTYTFAKKNIKTLLNVTKVLTKVEDIVRFDFMRSNHAYILRKNNKVHLYNFLMKKTGNLYNITGRFNNIALLLALQKGNNYVATFDDTHIIERYKNKIILYKVCNHITFSYINYSIKYTVINNGKIIATNYKKELDELVKTVKLPVYNISLYNSCIYYIKNNLKKYKNRIKLLPPNCRKHFGIN